VPISKRLRILFCLNISIQEEKKFKSDLVINEDALTINELYPSTEYDTELIDQKLNQWKVTKRTGLISFSANTPKIVDLPNSNNRKINSNYHCYRINFRYFNNYSKFL
jgi:ligand-binding sensor domain-containing protein